MALYIIKCFILRQINPKTNKTLAECLSEDVNKYNMMKLRVNAQIKAIVSFIEASVQISYVVIVYFTVRTNFGTLLIQSTLYLIILPYFSLMNTSYNKERIIESGWMGVIENLWVGKGINLSQTEDAISSHNKVEGRKGLEQSFSNHVNIGRNRIFTTSSSALDQRKNNKTSPLEQLSSDGSPSTSNGSQSDRDNQSFISPLGENRLKKQNKKSATSVDKIVSNMMLNTHDEDEYIRLLKQLVEHVDNPDQTQTFEDGSLPNSVPNIWCQQRNTRSKSKRSKQAVEVSNTSSRSKMILYVTELTIQSNENDIYAHNNKRKTFRDNILKQIRSCATDDHKKKLLIEELINKEEDYVL